MELTRELLMKAKETKSVEELMTLAKENGVEITTEDAEKMFAQLHQNGEIQDDELDNVSGGGCDDDENENAYGPECKYCGSRDTRVISDVKMELECNQWKRSIYCNKCGEKYICFVRQI